MAWLQDQNLICVKQEWQPSLELMQIQQVRPIERRVLTPRKSKREKCQYSFIVERACRSLALMLEVTLEAGPWPWKRHLPLQRLMWPCSRISPLMWPWHPNTTSNVALGPG